MTRRKYFRVNGVIVNLALGLLVRRRAFGEEASAVVQKVLRGHGYFGLLPTLMAFDEQVGHQ